jgi:FKBP-type peptidyl-prolyl cis-trans isomerase FkpA
MNRKILFILALSVITFAFGSCNKSDSSATQNNCTVNTTGVPTSAEIASLQAYLTANAITATFDSRGFFYQIITQGTGPTPNLASNVTVRYTGSLENGAIFDQNNAGATFLLNDLIVGWRYGLPLIQQGGSIKLFLPPTLGYGCNSVGGIPPGSNLIFTIVLTNVN